jgi:hypothetical protein
VAVRIDGVRLLVVAVVVALLGVTTVASPTASAGTVPLEEAACPAGEVPATGFTDLVGSVHDDAVRCGVWWEVIRGRSATSFAPQGPLTRGAAALLMVRVLDLADAELTATTPSVGFPDVGPGELREALTTLTALRVVTGYPDGTFQPNRTLERAQLASLLARTAAALGLDLPATPAGFADVGSSVHARSIDAMTALGVLQGRTSTTFAPAATATRAQAASVLVRLLGALVLDGQLTPPVSVAPDPDPCAVDEPPADCLVRLNELQVLGTHNSYKGPLPAPVAFILNLLDPDEAQALDYAHAPLTDQFEDQGARQIELDVFADPEGGRYAFPLGRVLADEVPEGGLPEFLDPGFKVMHVQDVDPVTSCALLVTCLEELRDWSDANPDHVPIAVLIETKQDPVPIDESELPIALPQDFVVPLPITPELLDDLDAEIRSVFDDDRMVLPDDVRGDHATLEDAVLAGSWPTLAASRGKVIFLMDQGGQQRTWYREGRPNLEGRVMFTPSSPGEADAAFLKVNEPLGNVDRIREAVAAGYVVRTRADVPTRDARENDTTRREAALVSGAQWVSTDYLVPSTFFESPYVVELPEGRTARCNPVNAPTACDDEALE